ncbi:MAG: pyridoxal-phosphate dependent enzyme [Actinomycetota bacterium]|nr:pyridoxal-phosphate dependent enzyme [Actinomycetota bacterium]
MISETEIMETNLFLRYRHSLDVYGSAIGQGLSDEQFVDLVSRLDARVANVAGTGFVVTPIVRLDVPGDREIVAKVETANVGGSHKARHLFGLLLFDALEAMADQQDDRPPLAVASCGNAALAAAVLARAADRVPQVFVPVDADPVVLAHLHGSGVTVVTCARSGGALGDPCMVGLQDAMARGAQAFTVQGTTCPNAFDGARTLGLELAEQLATVLGDGAFDLGAFDLYLQIGGGAMAVATMDGLRRADQSGSTALRARLHPVQTVAAHPFVAAWNRLQPILAAGPPTAWSAVIAASDVMQPWPSAPSSVATGILDDITYDWRPLMDHLVRSEGWPVLVSEGQLIDATALAASQVQPPPDATGAAGLAGALCDPGPLDARPAVVVLSGVDRNA